MYTEMPSASALEEKLANRIDKFDKEKESIDSSMT